MKSPLYFILGIVIGLVCSVAFFTVAYDLIAFVWNHPAALAVKMISIYSFVTAILGLGMYGSIRLVIYGIGDFFQRGGKVNRKPRRTRRNR